MRTSWIDALQAAATLKKCSLPRADLFFPFRTKGHETKPNAATGETTRIENRQAGARHREPFFPRIIIDHAIDESGQPKEIDERGRAVTCPKYRDLLLTFGQIVPQVFPPARRNLRTAMMEFRTERLLDVRDRRAAGRLGRRRLVFRNDDDPPADKSGVETPPGASRAAGWRHATSAR
jgi:hypothetical protein